MIAERNFLLHLRDLKLTPPRFSLNALTQNRLDVLLRCLSTTFYLSNSFRRDTNLFVVDQDESRLILFEGRHLKGLNPDERAIAGWLRKNLRSPNNSGLRVVSKEIEEFLREFSCIFVLAQEGTQIDEVNVFPSGALFTVGSHRGYSEKDKKVLETQGSQLLSLGRQEYLSSTTISIIQWTLDRHLLER
ncbi:MAG: hypothetical protein ACXADX_15810 [Candidatus Hodarchaeales archaeon]|jgi:tRNA pseudouridine-54 N-methylase